MLHIVTKCSIYPSPLVLLAFDKVYADGGYD